MTQNFFFFRFISFLEEIRFFFSYSLAKIKLNLINNVDLHISVIGNYVNNEKQVPIGISIFSLERISLYLQNIEWINIFPFITKWKLSIKWSHFHVAFTVLSIDSILAHSELGQPHNSRRYTCENWKTWNKFASKCRQLILFNWREVNDGAL